MPTIRSRILKLLCGGEYARGGDGLNANDPFEDTETAKTWSPLAREVIRLNANDPFEDTETLGDVVHLLGVGIGLNANDPFEDTETLIRDVGTSHVRESQCQRSVRGY